MADDVRHDFDDTSRISASTPRPDVQQTSDKERSEKQNENSSKVKDIEKRPNKGKGKTKTDENRKESKSKEKEVVKKGNEDGKRETKTKENVDSSKSSKDNKKEKKLNKKEVDNKESKKSKITQDFGGDEKDSDNRNESKKKPKKSSDEISNEEEDNDDDDESEEEEETEMTNEEKEVMYNAVRNGEWMTLQDCLEKKNADVNMTWYKENLLMAAIRAEQTDIAEFLIDIGIDYNYKTKLFHLRDSEKKGKRIDCHERSCRDLAFDLGNDHIVECIDVKNKNIFPFVPVKQRHIWSIRPPAPPIPKEMLPPEMQESDNEDDESEEESGECPTDSGHPSPRSHDKNTEDTLFSEMLGKLNDHGKDDGYDTMSPSLSPYLGHFSPHLYTPPEKPLVFHRATKASMALQSHNDQCYKWRRVPSKSAPAVRNVKAVGSYAHEKRLWEIQPEQPNPNEETTSVHSLPFLRSYTSSANSRRSSTQSTYSSPVAEVTRILGQSSLLNRNSNTKRSTHHSNVPSLKIDQWCHKNSNNVFNRLSKSAQQRKQLPDVNRHHSHHYRW